MRVVCTLAIAVAAAIVACSSEGVIGALAREAPDAGTPLEASVDVLDDAGAAPPLARSTTAIAAGGASTCVKLANNQMRCWGENRSGSLGIGDTEPPSSAEPVAPLVVDKVQALAAGEYAQCALTAAGKVFCWGDIFIGDFNGQLIEHMPSVSPFSMEAVGAIARVAVGRYFTCLLGTGGDVRCSGLNEHGQLGIGSKELQHLPTTVTGFDGPVTSISASMGGLFVCATTYPGSVYCWGETASGQILPGSGDVTTPQKVQGLTEPATEVVSGGSHACVRLLSGNVACWGAGDLGQLGDGKRTSSTTPVDAMYLTDVAYLAAGREHTCAVRKEGTVFCWGNDADGQTGGTPDPSRPSLVKPTAFGAKLVSCGRAHTCAWAAGGRVECWGSNSSSQLGPGQGTF
jgi:alpha-tubulin suppressor-like RCC1 family protein